MPPGNAMVLMGLTADQIGSRVRVTVPDGKYEGILYAIDLNNGRITLEKITVCKSGKTMSGLQNYFNYDILNLEIITDNRKKTDKKKEDCDGPLLVGRKQTNAHLRKLKPLNDEVMLLKTDERKLGAAKGAKEIDDGPKITRVKTLQEAQRKSTQDTLNLQKWPEHYILINQNNNVFKEALTELQKHAIIGLAIEGVKMGRHGQISFVQVSTRGYTFIFDVLALGRTLFDEGLKGILEYPKIQKVMHDCRWVSDALFHQYGVRLRNVFDTQVSSVICYRNCHSGTLPRYVLGLGQLLIKFLDFPSNYTYFYNEREGVESDQKVWLTRPAPERILKVATRHVMYLPALRVSLSEAMLSDFTDGVDIYLGVVRDSPEDRLSRLANETHLLPHHFSNMKGEASQMRRAFEHRYKNEDPLENMQGPHGFRENCIGSLNNEIIYSNDSVWHQGIGSPVRGSQFSRTQYLEECHRRGMYLIGCEENQRDVKRAYDVNKQEKKLAAREIENRKLEDDTVLALSMKKEKVKPQVKLPSDTMEAEKELVKEVPSTMYIPAGCPIERVELVSRDFRVTNPDIKLVDVDNDNAIPSHSNLVKLNPALRKPSNMAKVELPWNPDASDSSTNTSDSCTSPAGVNVECGLKAAVARGRGLFKAESYQGQNGHHSSASEGHTSSDDSPHRKMAGVGGASPKISGLGRGQLALMMMNAQKS